ncbi:hypothetical protein CC78DRAFT_543608 [Lojkania enalia]|uniref:Uncharacterized protein n=1 Tax=Lojkania enalia TaxID=147567 RepID=A0A9P4N8J1_9PLEO|nr:hypothetical protein CC78DRAFT_543608 [Didymosphaeria enalia]
MASLTVFHKFAELNALELRERIYYFAMEHLLDQRIDASNISSALPPICRVTPRTYEEATPIFLRIIMLVADDINYGLTFLSTLPRNTGFNSIRSLELFSYCDSIDIKSQHDAQLELLSRCAGLRFLRIAMISRFEHVDQPMINALQTCVRLEKLTLLLPASARSPNIRQIRAPAIILEGIAMALDNALTASGHRTAVEVKLEKGRRWDLECTQDGWTQQLLAGWMSEWTWSPSSFGE